MASTEAGNQKAPSLASEGWSGLEHLRDIVLNLPESPGCYQYIDKGGTVIYVGKAKNLKRRVTSYFYRPTQTAKTAILVRHIHDIKYVVVKTEEDALLLENNLIKRYKPRYNVLLKDDKSYPSIVITKEPFPRIFKTRNIVRGTGEYFGPYSHIPTLNALLELIRNLYPLRTCRQPITAQGIEQGKYKACLEYHIKNCKAPCVGRESAEQYNAYISQAREILRGNTASICADMMQQMQALAAEMRFEEAEAIKRRWQLLTDYRSRSEVIGASMRNVDVFTIEEDGDVAFINYLHVVNGAINQAFTFEYRRRMDETRDELLTMGIIEMRTRWQSKSPEIVLPFELDLPLHDVTLTVPKAGEKRKLLELSLLNVKQYKADRMKQADKLNPEQKKTRILKEIQDALHLPALPVRIECFDNSNISGSDPVAACVVFEMGKPKKSEYRHFNIKTVEGPDDYASMQEVVRRRYSRCVAEGTPLPHLIVTDGGKGQMEVVRRVVEDELHLDIPIAGLAKDNRHRTHELLYGFPPQTIAMKQGTPLFHLLTHLQDEVHRFAITFHRQKRSRRQTTSTLDSIPGIGPATRQTLLQHFHSLKRIREATLEELVTVIGPSKAQAIHSALAATSTPTPSSREGVPE